MHGRAAGTAFRGMGGGMRAGGMSPAAHFSGAHFAGPGFAHSGFAHSGFAPRFSRFAFHDGRLFHHRHHRFFFVGAPFAYAAYDGCWRRTWTAPRRAVGQRLRRLRILLIPRKRLGGSRHSDGRHCSLSGYGNRSGSDDHHTRFAHLLT